MLSGPWRVGGGELVAQHAPRPRGPPTGSGPAASTERDAVGSTHAAHAGEAGREVGGCRALGAEPGRQHRSRQRRQVQAVVRGRPDHDADRPQCRDARTAAVAEGDRPRLGLLPRGRRRPGRRGSPPPPRRRSPAPRERPARSASWTSAPSGVGGAGQHEHAATGVVRRPDRRRQRAEPQVGRERDGVGAQRRADRQVGVGVAVHRRADVAALDVEQRQRRRHSGRRLGGEPGQHLLQHRDPARPVPFEERRLRLDHGDVPARGRRRRSARTARARGRRRRAPTRRAGPGCGSIPTHRGPCAATAAASRSPKPAHDAGLLERRVHVLQRPHPDPVAASSPRCPAPPPRRPAPW